MRTFISRLETIITLVLAQVLAASDAFVIEGTTVGPHYDRKEAEVGPVPGNPMLIPGENPHQFPIRLQNEARDSPSSNELHAEYRGKEGRQTPCLGLNRY